MIDLHCHILPAIDDGAETVSDSIDLLCEEQKQGVDSIVFTPHFNFERTNLHDFCLAREHSMQSLNKALTQRNIDISVKLGAEVYFSVRMLDEDIEPLCFGDTNYILVEFPVNSRPYGLSRTMEDLIRRGYIPILAHVERYPYFSENVNELYDLVMKGCLAQVNAGAIIKSHASSLMLFVCSLRTNITNITNIIISTILFILLNKKLLLSLFLKIKGKKKGENRR